VFGGQDAHERPDHCLLAHDGQDLFTDKSLVFANDRHVRVVVGERERVKVNKYGEKCRRAGAVFQPLVLEARSAGTSKTTANIIKKQAMLAGHRMGSDPCFCTGGGCRNCASRFRCSTRTWSQCACRMVTRTTRGPRHGMQALRFSALSWCGRHRWEATHGQYFGTCRR
jgi:hypothetical protein